MSLGTRSGTTPGQLLQEARLGENDALGRLLEIYRNYLTLASRLQIDHRLRAKADPSDLVQQTFLQAKQSFAQFRGTTEAELRDWLTRILVSQVAQLVRQFFGTRGRDVHLEQQLSKELDRSSQVAQVLVAPGSSPSQHTARHEQAVLLADALAELPVDYREVIILRHFEELRFVEVAGRMGRSEEAVKKLWARALIALRAALGRDGDERAKRRGE